VPFPNHDRFWVDVVRLLKTHQRAGESIMAPDEFTEHFLTVFTFAASFETGHIPEAWIVVHKGMIGALHPTFLAEVRRRRRPVLANDVFVVFASSERLPRLAADDVHFQAFEKLADEAAQMPAPAAPPRRKSLARLPMRQLSTEQIRAEMNDRYGSKENDQFGGYEFPYLWDKVRYREIDEAFCQLLGPVRGSILELACGLGRNVHLYAGCDSYVGIDLSDVAIERARASFGDRPNHLFRQMDATRLDFADASFDSVLAIEIIEHVHEPERLIAESFRVLKPGGLFVINSINRDSLHLRMVRKLGHGEFLGTSEHIREFSFREMKDILRSVGFTIGAHRGTFLMPYLGIPELEQHVRHLTYDDPEMVEVFRHLGELAGAEYAFEYVVAANKPAS
jgi:SAM-dependent methyltransferase